MEEADRPLTAEEEQGNRMLQDAVEVLRRTRRILTADELYEMRNLKPRVENELRLPDDANGRALPVFMFTIDGLLRGTMMRGCLFCGDCIIIQTATLERAEKLAKDGLQFTQQTLRDEYENRPALEVANDPINSGIAVDGKGRNGRPVGDMPLRTDPKLKDMIAHIIGGQPWKH